MSFENWAILISDYEEKAEELKIRVERQPFAENDDAKQTAKTLIKMKTMIKFIKKAGNAYMSAMKLHTEAMWKYGVPSTF